jgi:hyperosmotically inducible periplasmic protein
MKMNKNSRSLAMSVGLMIGAALPCAMMLGVTGCAGDRYHRSTGESIDDGSLRMRVSSALGNNPDYKFADVKVTVFKGTVQLSGFVNHSIQKSKAGEIAKTVQGVRSVANKITVQDESERAAAQSVDNKALAGKVQGALVDNPDYKFDGVRVTARDGTVQLSGFVNTSDQKSHAAQIAKQIEGATEVVNNITVKD